MLTMLTHKSILLYCTAITEVKFDTKSQLHPSSSSLYRFPSAIPSNRRDQFQFSSRRICTSRRVCTSGVEGVCNYPSDYTFAGMATGMASVDKSKELGRLATNIIPHILNLYNCKATAADYEIYAPNATFEDPLMKAHGVAQIKSAFYSIPKVFKEGKMLEYTVEEEEKTPDSGEIRLHNKQQYKILSKTIDVRSLIKLQVEEGKVVRHVDLWDENPLWDRQSVRFPLVGRLAETGRRVNMMVTHVLMGFGKDPRSA